MEELRKDKFKWVSSIDHGLRLLRLLETSSLDHCVVVDNARRVVFDSCKLFAYALSVGVMHYCGGGLSEKLVIAEVRQICPADYLE